MFEERNVRLDLFALALLALVVFIGLSLVSYHRADSAWSDSTAMLVYPATTDVSNICGRAGAWTADRLLRLLGVGAYYMLASLLALDVWLLLRRTITQRAVRITGWLFSLVGFVTLAALTLPVAAPELWRGPELGPGGVLGAAGRGLLEMHFATTGAFILALTLIVTGLLMCTDYVLLKLGLICVKQPSKAIARTGRAALGRRREYEEDELDEADEDDQEEDDGELQVRILGRRVKSKAEAEPEAEDDDEYEEECDEYEEDEYEDEEQNDETADEIEQPAKVGVGRRIKSALRIKPPQRTERDEMIESLEAASHDDELEDYQLPELDLLLESEEMHYAAHEKEVRRKAKILEKTFANFGFNVKVVEIETGPVIAQYEVELEAGLRLSKITGLADDLAIALRVPSVRIVAPIPGKNTVGIEVPNTERQLVRMREVMDEDQSKHRKMKIPVFLGKDVSGNPMTVDLATLPHLLIAGRTGTGKSVCLNSIISSMVMTRRPDEVKMLMIDPKMVELSPYKRLPHLMHPVVTDMKKAEAILAWAVDKMEERYALLASAGVRHVSVYNQLGEEELMDRIKPESDEARDSIPLNLPYIVIIADEMADLMMTAAKEVEGHIIRLAQKSRAVGIHLVLATQKPTVDVITGLIKSNLPARIAFQVASRTDSRVVLDEMGADKLLGNGDMLFLSPGTSTLLRGQGTFLGDDEITRLVESVATDEPQYVHELVQLKPAGADGDKDRFKDRDELYESAINVVVNEGRGSVSLLQRALGIGYGRAARLIDFMAEDGIVGSYNGSQAREVLVTPEQWATMVGEDEEEDVAPEPAPARRNKIQLAVRGEVEVEEDEYEEESEWADDEEAAHEDEAEEDQSEYEEEDEYEEEAAEYEEEEYEEGYEEENEDEEAASEEAEDAEYEEGEYEEEEYEEEEYEEEEYESDEYVEEEEELEEDDEYHAQSA
jgi:S-DNA-T family DNA segregation ATPase FtsK/SpoIIIE